MGTLVSGSTRRRDPSLLSYIIFVLWLEGGYLASLVVFARVRPATALWQAAICIIAIPPLLFLVLRVLNFPKRFLRSLPKAAIRVVGAVAGTAQFMLPWAGWTVLLWAINRGSMTWAAALRGGASVAGFSYLTGFGLVLLFGARTREVEMSRFDIPVAGLPEQFDGYRILHMSDLHVSPFNPASEVVEQLAAAREVEADLIVFTGDLADRGQDRIEAAAEALVALSARDGITAVLGNHDNWIGQERVRAALGRRGVKVLVNEHVIVRRGAGKLYVAGVNDASYTEGDDLPAALEGIPEGDLVVLLSHAPEIVWKTPAGRPAVVLAGHTHGGQIVLPWVGPLYVPSGVPRRYASGLHRLDGQWLFVTRGMGEVFPNLRIGCPREIALLTLRQAAA